ncbi:MAG: hypothetical protein H6725_07240 [Sandaracinaceae bacterium]|nr:hypothetical protein [Sandaracinaceae bacterium]
MARTKRSELILIAAAMVLGGGALLPGASPYAEQGAAEPEAGPEEAR